MELSRDFETDWHTLALMNEEHLLTRHKGTIYHYTSSSGFNGIISNSTLRFTDRAYLNDKSEYTYILDLCLENLDSINLPTETIKSIIKKKLQKAKMDGYNDSYVIFQCSFSLDKDSLALWNYYSKSDGIRGYNIGFNISNINLLLIPKIAEMGGSSPLMHGKVMYEKEEQLNALRILICYFNDYFKKYSDTRLISELVTILVEKIKMLGVFMKPACFQMEKEYRLAYSLLLNDMKEETKKYFEKRAIEESRSPDNLFGTSFWQILNEQKFMEKDGCFIPYVDIGFNPYSVNSITMSPTIDSERGKMSIYRMMLGKYKNVSLDNIVQSTIPVRY